MTLPNMQDGKANRGQTGYDNHYQMFAPRIESIQLTVPVSIAERDFH